jgi:hypothetical protein
MGFIAAHRNPFDFGGDTSGKRARAEPRSWRCHKSVIRRR